MLQFLIVQVNFLYRIEKLPSYYAPLITEHLFCEVESQGCNQDLVRAEDAS